MIEVLWFLKPPCRTPSLKVIMVSFQLCSSFCHPCKIATKRGVLRCQTLLSCDRSCLGLGGNTGTLRHCHIVHRQQQAPLRCLVLDTEHDQELLVNVPEGDLCPHPGEGVRTVLGHIDPAPPQPGDHTADDGLPASWWGWE